MHTHLHEVSVCCHPPCFFATQRAPTSEAQDRMRQTMQETGVQTGPYWGLEVDECQPDQQERYGHSKQRYRQRRTRDEVRLPHS